MKMQRRAVHTFMETLPRRAHAQPVTIPRDIALLPTRPRPVSQLRIPEHSSQFSMAAPIRALFPEEKDAPTTKARETWDARAAPDPKVRQDRSRRATISATVTGVAAVAIASGLFLARSKGPVHAEGAPTAAENAPWMYARIARRLAHTQADQIQLVKHAAQLGSI